MTKHVKIGDVFEFKDRCFGIVVSLTFSVDRMKLRKIRACVGKHSEKARIGKPYTYQVYTSEKSIFKKARKIGSEELLNILWSSNGR